MRELFKRYHIWMKLSALLIAIVLWAVVIYNENPERTIDVANIPVELLGQASLLQNSGLVVSQIENETAFVKLSGTFSALSGVDADDITARADVSRYTEAGSYTISYQVSIPDGTTVVERTPLRITIVIEEIVEKELPVRVEYVGALEDGIYLDEATVEPATVTVSGTASIMEQAAYAVVKLDASLLTTDYSDTCEYVITDAEGNELESEFTRHIDSTVQVDIPVYMSKAVPVEVSVVASAGVPKNSIVVAYDPAEVVVYGRASDISSLKSINLGEVSVRDFVLTYDQDFPLTLPEGVSFYEEEVETVNVHVSFRDIDTIQLAVTNISLENVPETAVVDLETTNLEVTVRGQTDKLTNVDASNFRVSVDLSEVDLQEGRQLVPATVKISVGGYDVCGTYSVIINVMETGER